MRPGEIVFVLDVGIGMVAGESKKIPLAGRCYPIFAMGEVMWLGSERIITKRDESYNTLLSRG